MTTVSTMETLPQQLARKDVERLRAYRESLAFSRGRQWEGRARGRERRLTFNYTKAFVDKVTAYMMSGMSFVVESSERGEEAQERARRGGGGRGHGGAG